MKPRTLKSQNILFLWIVSLMILLNAQCILFRENPLDPNGDLSRLIGFLQLSRIEQTVTRTEWELLDEIGEPPFTVIGIRQISPPSEFFTNTPEGFPRFVLEQRGSGEYEYLITDVTNSLELGRLKINVTENATEESLNSTLIGSTNYTVHLRDFFQGRESEVSPFISINKIGQSPDGIDYSIGFTIQGLDFFGSLKSYLIRGNNPSNWEITELINLPDFNSSSDKRLLYFIYFLDNGAFLVANESCELEPTLSCLNSIQAFIANINYNVRLPSKTLMRVAERLVSNQRLDFSESLVFNGKLVYKTIEEGPPQTIRYYRTNDGYLSSPSTHNALGSLGTLINVRFQNPIQFTPDISQIFIDDAIHTPVAIDSNTLNFIIEGPNALFDPFLPSGYQFKDYWIHGNRVFKTIFDQSLGQLEVYGSSNPYSVGTTTLDQELNFSRLSVLPISNLGSPLSSISYSPNIYTIYYFDRFDPNDPTASRVLSSIDGGNSWVLTQPPRLNTAGNLFYISRVLDGRIFLTRQSFVGMEYYTSSDGVNWERTRIRHRRIP